MASEQTGNSRGYLSRLFREHSDIGIARFFSICRILDITIDQKAISAAANNRPFIDEISDLCATGIDDHNITPFLNDILIYAAPENEGSTPSLLHMGQNSLAAKVLTASTKAGLQQAVNNFPDAAKRKLVASYMVAASGTSLISIERLSAHVHGQPRFNELAYKRFLFPISQYQGSPAVGLYAVTVSKFDKLRTSSIDE